MTVNRPPDGTAASCVARFAKRMRNVLMLRPVYNDLCYKYTTISWDFLSHNQEASFNARIFYFL